MSLSIRIPSGEQTTDRKKVASRKRRRNQNAVIDELASLVSLPTPPQLSNSVDSNPVRSLVPSFGNAPSAVDKISVLRLTTTFLKLQDFMTNAAPANNERSAESAPTLDLLGLMQQAMDGFLIVLDKEANVLYVSETITGYVGLSQQEVIGQNLVDVTHSDSATEIADSLKPSVVSSTSVHMAEDSAYVISQYRQFFLKFKSTVAHSRYTTHTLVQVSGNLKVKIPPLKKDQLVEVVEPSVVGFIGECHLIKSSASILEISIPHSTFTSTVTLDFQPISIEARVKEIIGYDLEDFIGVDELDFIHPADYPRLLPARQYLVETGHSVSPHFRFLAKSGDWLWMQVEGTLHCKAGTSIPLFYEYKAKVLSQGGGRIKYIEQKEIYASTVDPSQQKTSSKITNTPVCCRTIDSLKSTKMPESILEPVLQARSETMRKHSELIKLLVDGNSTTATQAKLQEYNCKNASNGTTASPASSSSPPLITVPSSSVTSGSTSHNGSTCLDTDNSRSLPSLQAQAVSPLSHSSESLSSNTPLASCSPASSSTVRDNSTFQIGWLASQNCFMQDLQVEPFDPSACYPVDQNGVQGLLDSDPNSSPASLIPATSPAAYSTLSPSPIRQGAVSPGQFLDQASPISNYGSVMSGTSSCNDVAVSDVSSPSTVFSPEMVTGSCTSVGGDSIPLSAFSIPFQNSQPPTFVPQAPALNDFNPQIPSSFDFSYAQMSNQTLFSDLDNSALDAQALNTSSLFLNPSEFVTQHPAADHVTCPTPNGTDTRNTGDAVVPNLESKHGIMDRDSNSHLHANVTLNHDSTNFVGSQSCDCLLDSQTNNSSDITCSSNSEVQDILQQFF